MHDVLDDGVFLGVQHGVVDQTEEVEDRDEPDEIGPENEDEKGQDQRRPGHDELAPDIWKHDGIPDVLDDELEAVHEPRRHHSVLA